MKTKLIMLAGVAISIAAVTQALAQADANETSVAVLGDRVLGPYIVTADGTALYVFSLDVQNSNVSACDAACQEVWEPFVTDFEPPSAAEGARGALIGMFSLGGGVSHITYNGYPLYTYAEDAVSRDMEGLGHEEFGGTWNMMTPEGELITLEDANPAPVAPSGGFGGAMFPG